MPCVVASKMVPHITMTPVCGGPLHMQHGTGAGVCDQLTISNWSDGLSGLR